MKSVIDIVIVIIIFYFLLSGIRRGLIRQILDVLGIIAAFIGSFYLAHRLAAYLESSMELSYNICLIMSAVILFIGIIILFHFISLTLKKLINMTILGSFDRIMGGLFGAIKGLLFSSLILVILFSLPINPGFKKELERDRFISFVKPVLPVLFDAVASIGPGELDFDRITRSKKHFIEKSRKKMQEIRDNIDRKKDKIKESVPGTDPVQS
ncbi:MAG TPA: CvpA family protein [Candidatus Krumholzibacteriaceae bacterium]|nr:CvpA family protein [Candidatus Krumholzibacteriaceae bacterium]